VCGWEGVAEMELEAAVKWNRVGQVASEEREDCVGGGGVGEELVGGLGVGGHGDEVEYLDAVSRVERE